MMEGVGGVMEGVGHMPTLLFTKLAGGFLTVSFLDIGEQQNQ